MVQKRNIALCVVLSLVTFGIYGIYWFIKLTDESNDVSGTPTASGGKAFLFSLITCSIYSFYWMYKLGEKIDTAKSNRGMASSSSGVLYLVLSIFGLGIVSYCLAQNELNKLAD